MRSGYQLKCLLCQEPHSCGHLLPGTPQPGVLSTPSPHAHWSSTNNALHINIIPIFSGFQAADVPLVRGISRRCSVNRITPARSKDKHFPVVHLLLSILSDIPGPFIKSGTAVSGRSLYKWHSLSQTPHRPTPSRGMMIKQRA